MKEDRILDMEKYIQMSRDRTVDIKWVIIKCRVLND